ncbi:PAS domain-containing protein [Rhodohalobacter sp. 8-1]|uniref:PAS domain-containing protein n=1 Tax=Rhodohalobacter sp. 8-1 TaxID=3131972 RepID=UPI0030EEE47A
MTEENRTKRRTGGSDLADGFQKIDLNGDVFRQIFKHSVIPVIVHDMDMNIIDANDSAVGEFGYEKKPTAQ